MRSVQAIISLSIIVAIMSLGFIDSDKINSVKYIFRSVGVTNTDQCGTFAFGDKWEELLIRDVKDRWNEKHGKDIFMLHDEDIFAQSIQDIGIICVARGY